MPKATLTFHKHARGEYEIGMQTDDGAIVATVCIGEGRVVDTRSDGEREAAALKKAARLARTFSTVLG
jgi:hypothetical protein